MAGLQKDTPNPVEIVVHRQSRVIEIAFDNTRRFRLPFELLRVYSPSAEVRGHGAGQEILQTGKRDVLVDAVEPVGHYAIKPIFSDGHDTGIYSWDYLYWLGESQEKLWHDYLKRLAAAGASRDSDPPAQAASDASPSDTPPSDPPPSDPPLAATEIRRR